MEMDEVVWSSPGRQEARGCGLRSVTSESCVEDLDKGKHDGKVRRKGLGRLLSITYPM